MPTEYHEPRTIINGTHLTDAQSMTLRVAVGNFITTLKEDGLGDDNHVKSMTSGYLDRLYEIQALMHKE